MESNQPIGTEHSNYAGPKDGPFACHACTHFKFPHLCNHPEVIADAKAGNGGLRLQGKNGFAIVAPGGCCTYFRP